MISRREHDFPMKEFIRVYSTFGNVIQCYTIVFGDEDYSIAMKFH